MTQKLQMEPTEFYSTDALDESVRTIKVHNHTLLEAGYTDQQIVGLANTAMQECGDLTSIDEYFQAGAAALEAEVLRLGLTHTKFPQKLSNDQKVIDVSDLDWQSVADRSYRFVDPIPESVASDLDVMVVENEHLNMVRHNSDECSDVEFYIEPYLIGHTADGESVFVVVHTETRDHCFYIDENGKIDGGGTGHSHLVVCPAEAEASLREDLIKWQNDLVERHCRQKNQATVVERFSETVSRLDDETLDALLMNKDKLRAFAKNLKRQ
jgi:hypothetical protein